MASSGPKTPIVKMKMKFILTELTIFLVMKYAEPKYLQENLVSINHQKLVFFFFIKYFFSNPGFVTVIRT